MSRPDKQGLGFTTYTIRGVVTNIQKLEAATTSLLTIKLKDDLEEVRVFNTKKFEKDKPVDIHITVTEVTKKKAAAAIAGA